MVDALAAGEVQDELGVALGLGEDEEDDEFNKGLRVLH